MDLNVVLIPTKHSMSFLLADSGGVKTVTSPTDYLNKWQQLQPNLPLKIWFEDKDEWESWTQRSDPVLHVELQKVANVLLIAPLSANTMGKFANGLADNLITNVFRAWDFHTETCIVAPAMNTFMYKHPVTEIQEQFLREKLNVKVLPTVEKTLICGDKGLGAMQNVEEIVAAVKLINTNKVNK